MERLGCGFSAGAVEESLGLVQPQHRTVANLSCVEKFQQVCGGGRPVQGPFGSELDQRFVSAATQPAAAAAADLAAPPPAEAAETSTN